MDPNILQLADEAKAQENDYVDSGISVEMKP